MSLRILHLVSNWKLTGPVAPALELAHALQARGHEVHAALGRPRVDDGNQAMDHARHLGLPVVGDLSLGKHFQMLENVRDVARLRRLVAENHYDILHAHGTNDHLLAAGTRYRPDRRIVRSLYGGTVDRLRQRDRLLVARAVGGVVVPGAAEEAWARGLRPDLEPDRVVRLPGAVDLARFDPGRFSSPMPRSSAAFRVGVVARVQTHRRWEDLLDALERVGSGSEKVQLVVVGRGTHYDRLLREPVARRGLSDRVELAGYLTGDDYVRKLLSLDAAVFLVPGSDGTCRAVREFMALGRPMIVAPEGLLPELVEHGTSGLVLEGPGSEPLARAMTCLARDRTLCTRLGGAARARAVRDFDLVFHAKRIEALYAHILRYRRFAPVRRM